MTNTEGLNRRSFLQSLLGTAVAIPAGAILMPWGEIWKPKIMVPAAKIGPYIDGNTLWVPPGCWRCKDYDIGAEEFRSLRWRSTQRTLDTYVVGVCSDNNHGDVPLEISVGHFPDWYHERGWPAPVYPVSMSASMVDEAVVSVENKNWGMRYPLTDSKVGD